MGTLTTFPPAYVYVEYNDDENIQAFFAALNTYQQSYLDVMLQLNLPIYTVTPDNSVFLSIPASGLFNGFGFNDLSYDASGSSEAVYDSIVGLLDWVVNGIYGIARPALSNSAPVNDDLYRRIVTWQFFKGDGFNFNVRWLKRRVMRFLFGPDGIDPGVSETYPVSVSYAQGKITIRFPNNRATVTGGAIFNRNTINALVPLNSLTSTSVAQTQPADAPILKEAIDSGILPLPFQYTYNVQLS